MIRFSICKRTHATRAHTLYCIYFFRVIPSCRPVLPGKGMERRGGHLCACVCAFMCTYCASCIVRQGGGVVVFTEGSHTHSLPRFQDFEKMLLNTYTPYTCIGRRAFQRRKHHACACALRQGPRPHIQGVYMFCMRLSASRRCIHDGMFLLL